MSDRPNGAPAAKQHTELDLIWHDGHRRGAGLLIVVHGFAEHPTAALQLGSLLDPRHAFRVCAPVGTVPAGRHKLAFYRSTSRMTPEPASFHDAVRAIRSAVERACAETGTEIDRAVLVGMSQGAGLAVAAALGRSDRSAPGRLVLFSGRPYPDELVEWDFPARGGMRIFAAHGTTDRLSPHAAMRAFLEQAERSGITVDWRTHHHGHTLDPDSVSAAARWLSGSVS